jgi:hypothetical protein
MSAGIIWAWIVANQTSVTTILLIVSELLGASSKVKANGILSFVLLQIQEQLKKRGAKDPTP